MVALFDTLMNNKRSIHENMHVHEYFQKLPTTTTLTGNHLVFVLIYVYQKVVKFSVPR